MSVSARTRAVYHDVGRTSSGAGPSGMKNMPSSVLASSVVHTKLKVFQHAELHDEYFKLVDVVTELKAACQHEQAARVKSMARVRRLEEIVAMKDKKIEMLLQKADNGATGTGSSSSAMHRDLAYKERQYHGMIQKMQLKIAQQSQLLASYEDAIQSLRSSIKSTNVMQLEEERNQLYIELRHLQEKYTCQRMENNSQERKIAELQQLDTSTRQQLTKVQQEHKRTQCEKQKAEQDIILLKSSVDQLQSNVILLQRKRAYDREVANNAHDQRGLTPSRSVLLAHALEELKHVMRKESSTPAASVQRERMKALSTAKPSVSTPRTPKGMPPSNPTPPSSKVQSATTPTQRTVRPANAGPSRLHRVIASKSTTAIGEHCSQKDGVALQEDTTKLVDVTTFDKEIAGDESKQEIPVLISGGDVDEIQSNSMAEDCDSVLKVTPFHDTGSTTKIENGCSNDKQSAASPELLQADTENISHAKANAFLSERSDSVCAGSTTEEKAVSDQLKVFDLSAVPSLESLQRKEIADIERLLRDMDTAGSGMLDSASSEEFLEDAESQFVRLDRPEPTIDADANERDDEDDDLAEVTELKQPTTPLVSLDYEQRYESDFTENNDNDCTAEGDDDVDDTPL